MAAQPETSSGVEGTLTVEQVIVPLSLLANGTLRDFVQVGGQGRPTISLKEATEAQLYMLNEVTHRVGPAAGYEDEGQARRSYRRP